jgi:pimeloyl-ACP methyl ester carboxylesterase
MTAQQETVTVDGLRTPLTTSGPADLDEAAVFVHGNPGSGSEFAALLDAVGKFGRAVAPDMPGFGTADKPADFDYTTAGYARHLDGVLAAVGVRRAHLVLHDFGGPWGLTWASENLDRVGSVTLINTGVLLNYRWHYLAKIWRTPGLGEAFMATSTRPAFTLLLRHGNPRGLPAPFFDEMWNNFDRGTRRAVLRLYRATPDPAGDSLRLHTALRPRHIPALVVWGARDPYSPVALAHRQRETFPGADVVLLDDSGHWAHADNPDAVASVVVPFLRRQLAPQPSSASGGFTPSAVS